METKSLLESKTLWLNVAAIIIALLAMPEVVGILPVTWLPYIAAITAVLNVIVRMYTTQPIGK